jgi:hypothetical protein
MDDSLSWLFYQLAWELAFIGSLSLVAGAAVVILVYARRINRELGCSLIILWLNILAWLLIFLLVYYFIP